MRTNRRQHRQRESEPSLPFPSKCKKAWRVVIGRECLNLLHRPRDDLFMHRNLFGDHIRVEYIDLKKERKYGHRKHWMERGI